ncbi:hypothetical protein HPP92_009999 [Vanilla planifolia]|nr:hypothetical protein HPP92_009999 [Vanilla planifolia]
MAFYVKVWLFVLAVLIWAEPNPTTAEVFTVGDSVGWTTLNRPNYTAWAAGKTFRVGDTLLFKYHKEYHNVLVVKEADYEACKNSSALFEYHSGEDAVIIKEAGRHFYICGFSNHCQIGQKFDIKAIVSSAALSNPPANSPQSNAGGHLKATPSIADGTL